VTGGDLGAGQRSPAWDETAGSASPASRRVSQRDHGARGRLWTIRRQLLRSRRAYHRGMTRSAAFFDLDKTILAKSSSLAFARPFYKGGLLGRSDVLKSAYAQFTYLSSGADHDQMETMRHYMSELVKGWDVETVRQIVSETLDEIVDPFVYEEAVDLIEEHKEAGRDVIIISSSGTEVVEPIGERLGVDRAIGTQVEIVDGKYTGEILFYAYGEGKADAMRALAAENGYDLADSYAYTDSMTDLPMLEIVGHPVCVNPDATLRRTAVERGWPVVDFARPVAMPTVRQRIAGVNTPDNRRNALVAGAATVALGLAWYAGRRRGAS
jgi:HAD superfamily hydrolase (TIGR01490 family)